MWTELAVYDRALFAFLPSSVRLVMSNCNMQSQQSHGFSYIHHSLVNYAIVSSAEAHHR